MTCFVVPDGVRAEPDNDGRLVVLNENTGNWHLLNRTGADLFRELARTPDIDRALDRLATRYRDVPRDHVRADMERMTAELVRRGLLEPVGAYNRQPAAVLMATQARPAGIPHRHRLLTVVAFALALVLLKLPFRMSTNVVAMLKQRMTTRDATTSEALDRLVAARLVTSNYPGRVACLELSLTAVLAAALQRQRVDWCFGFASDPQRFHAWVEVDGTPVTEPTDDPIVPTYRRMVRV